MKMKPGPTFPAYTQPETPPYYQAHYQAPPHSQAYYPAPPYPGPPHPYPSYPYPPPSSHKDVFKSNFLIFPVKQEFTIGFAVFGWINLIWSTFWMLLFGAFLANDVYTGEEPLGLMIMVFIVIWLLFVAPLWLVVYLWGDRVRRKHLIPAMRVNHIPHPNSMMYPPGAYSQSQYPDSRGYPSPEYGAPYYPHPGYGNPGDTGYPYVAPPQEYQNEQDWKPDYRSGVAERAGYEEQVIEGGEEQMIEGGEDEGILED